MFGCLRVGCAIDPASTSLTSEPSHCSCAVVPFKRSAALYFVVRPMILRYRTLCGDIMFSALMPWFSCSECRERSHEGSQSLAAVASRSSLTAISQPSPPIFTSTDISHLLLPASYWRAVSARTSFALLYFAHEFRSTKSCGESAARSTLPVKEKATEVLYSPAFTDP